MHFASRLLVQLVDADELLRVRVCARVEDVLQLPVNRFEVNLDGLDPVTEIQLGDLLTKLPHGQILSVVFGLSFLPKLVRLWGPALPLWATS